MAPSLGFVFRGAQPSLALDTPTGVVLHMLFSNRIRIPAIGPESPLDLGTPLALPRRVVCVQLRKAENVWGAMGTGAFGRGGWRGCRFRTGGLDSDWGEDGPGFNHL